MRPSTEVLGILSSAETDGPALRMLGPLGRSQYVAVNQVLEAAGGKWNRAAKAHLFPSDAAQIVDQILLSGEVIDAKQEFGFFETPAPVVERLLTLARLEPEMRVLEPSAGRGAIARAVRSAGCLVNCYELLDQNVEALGEMFLDVRQTDFLTEIPEPWYDRVIMNPPFARQADIAHVTHALKFVKQDGALVSVMSAGVTFRQDRKTAEFRHLIAKLNGRFEQLPEGAFKSSGTSVRTVIAVVPA